MLRISVALFLSAFLFTLGGTLRAEEKTPHEAARKAKVDFQAVKPELPQGEGLPVDRWIASYRQSKKLPTPGELSDELFLRRIHLDLVGRLPTVAQREKFLADKSPDKREQVIDSLLADNAGYADHWITFWQDLLRDGKRDLGSTDIFRPITPWLHKSLVDNKPLDQFVRELVAPNELEKLFTGKAPSSDDGEKFDVIPINDRDPSGFVFGTRAGLERPRGDQAWEVQAAQNICQVFLGIQLKCATCHDSFLDSWTMDDAWGMASIYAAKPLEMVRCELPTGKTASARFVIPQLGNVNPDATPAERRSQMAALLTSKENGLFARTAVNRIWTGLMGRGLVLSADDMSEACWNRDLLNWLAADFTEHDFDLKHLIRTIVASRTYQSPAFDYNAKQAEEFVFQGPALRRLQAEQYLDGIHALVGREKRVWRDNGSQLMEVLGRPDRRTITTCRDSKATTMQSLELLNGPAIHSLIYGLKSAAAKIPGESGVKLRDEVPLKPSPLEALKVLAARKRERLVAELFQHALARDPSEQELAVCKEIVDEKPTVEQAGDLVWMLVMLPEFQLIQ